MKNPHDAMQDPFYANILYVIETKLHEGDLLATTRGLKLTDSAVRSALVKASHVAKGHPSVPASANASAKDKFLGELVEQLGRVRAGIRVQTSRPDGSGTEEAPLPAKDWLIALECVRDSCELRSNGQPGSRSYLDYLGAFLRGS